MSFLDRIFSAAKDTIVWAGFDLQRVDNAAAQAVVLIDPATNDAYSLADTAQNQSRIAVTTTYVVTTNFLGGGLNDVLTCTQLIDASGETPTTLATLWRNHTTTANLAGAPDPANISLLGSKALTDAQLRAAPVPVAVSSATEIEVKNDAGSPLSVQGVSLSYTDQTVASLSSGQAAGTSAILGVSAARKALVIVPPADCTLTLVSGATTGIPLYAGIPNTFIGAECPSNALFILGLTTGQSVTMWEA